MRHPAKLSNTLGTIFKTTRLICNQKFFTYKIRKLIDSEYIFDKKILLVEKIINFIFAYFIHI